MDNANAGRFSSSSAVSSSRLKYLKLHDELFSSHVLQLRLLFIILSQKISSEVAAIVETIVHPIPDCHS